MPTTRGRLLPGVHVTRRDADHLQIGVDRPHRVVLRDSPETRGQLRALVRGSRVSDTGLLGVLDAAGLLSGDDAPASDRPGRPLATLIDRGFDVAALSARLTEAGVAHRVGDAEAHDLRVLATTALLNREASDELVATGQPHLLIHGTGTPGVLRVGPFVVPGATACLRCVDAHESECDPRRGLVIAQLASRPGVEVAATDLALALAWVARDLVAWSRGQQPTTWSASVDVGPGAVPRVTSWARHPACGCAWDELAW